MAFEKFKSYLKSKAGINDLEFEKLAKAIQHKKFAKNEFLLKRGEICKFTFFVEEGLLRSYSIDEGGKEHINQFAPEDWFISDRGSVYFNEPSDFFIDAVEESSVIFIDKEFIVIASEVSATFREFNNKALHNHIRHLQKRIDLLIGASAEKRYLSFIQLYPDLLLRVPQWMIASYLGITPESLSRVRKEMTKLNSKHPD